MTTNMDTALETKKGILILYQSPVRRSVEMRVDRRMVEAFARIEGADGTVPSKGIYKIRNGEQHPWRVIIRRFAEASAKRTKAEQIDHVLNELRAVVHEELFGKQASA